MKELSNALNRPVENWLDIVILFTLLVCMVVALPFYTVYVYIHLGIRNLFG